MHTPGRELFCGVIHPSAGLFEDYFDVDKAAEEHRGYIAMLEANGIRVHTVTDILQEVGIDSLRALADNVLIFDISGIPEENPEATEEYRQDVLSKMSRADLIRCILLQPMVKLWRTDNNTGLGDDDKVVMMQELGEDELDEATGGTAVSPPHIIRLSASSNSK